MSQFLLIHGAWHGAWCWRNTVRELEKRGRKALAIDLPGQGDDQTPLAAVTLDVMADRIVAALRELSTPVVLVGHSLGGMVISAAAEKAPEQIDRLLYLCAFLPRNGESVLSLEQRNPKVAVLKNLIVADDHVSGTIMPDRVRDLFYHDCRDLDVTHAAARLRPQALGPLSTAVHLTAERFGRIPRGYIECTDDRALSIELQRDMISKSQPVEVCTLSAGHSPFLSIPDGLAAALIELSSSGVR
jgi:pimeloyl-ACP methyl ester carboxylesterase